MVDLKRKRNRRVDSFIWTNTMLHKQTEELIVTPPATSHIKKGSNIISTTSRVNEKENMLGSTQYLYQLLQGNYGGVQSNSKSRTHQRNQTSFNCTAKGSFLGATSMENKSKASFISKGNASNRVHHQKTSSKPGGIINAFGLIKPTITHKPSPSISAKNTALFQTPVVDSRNA